MFEFKLFVAQPINKAVYYIRNTNTGTHTIINANTLQPIDKLAVITEVIRIKGDIITEYEINPLVVGNENGEYFIVYAPHNDNRIYDSSGIDIRKMNYGTLVSATEISIPDLNNYKSGSLPIVPLLSPNMLSLELYNELNNRSENLIEEKLIGNYSPAPLSSVLSIFEQADNKETAIISSTPNTINRSNMSNTPSISNTPSLYRADPGTGTMLEISQMKSELEKKIELLQTNEVKEAKELSEMKKDILQLYDVLNALIKRIYGGYMYPVIRKTPMRSDGVELKQMSVDDYNKLSSENKLEKVSFDAILQPYAGSQRNDNRILTVYDKSGNAYYVECSYDPKTQKVAACKYS